MQGAVQENVKPQNFLFQFPVCGFYQSLVFQYNKLLGYGGCRRQLRGLRFLTLCCIENCMLEAEKVGQCCCFKWVRRWCVLLLRCLCFSTDDSIQKFFGRLTLGKVFEPFSSLLATRWKNSCIPVLRQSSRHCPGPFWILVPQGLNSL